MKYTCSSPGTVQDVVLGKVRCNEFGFCGFYFSGIRRTFFLFKTTVFGEQFLCCKKPLTDCPVHFVGTTGQFNSNECSNGTALSCAFRKRYRQYKIKSTLKGEAVRWKCNWKFTSENWVMSLLGCCAWLWKGRGTTWLAFIVNEGTAKVGGDRGACP